MIIGQVVMTTKFDLRSAVNKPTVRATFKSKPDTAMVFIFCGGVRPGEDPVAHVERVLEAKGWTPPAEQEGHDEGIERAFKGEQP